MTPSSQLPGGVPSTSGILRTGGLIKSLPSRFSPSQISQYLARIGFQHDPESFSPNLRHLERLSRQHLLSIPLDNTEMHYTIDHEVDITPQGLFQRFVIESNGGNCVSHCTMFLDILRGLGYRAYRGMARMNNNRSRDNVGVPPELAPLSHNILFVQPFPTSDPCANQTYLVDGWCGPETLVRPILLSDAVDNIALGPSALERHRLTRRPHPHSSIGETDLLWNLECQVSCSDDDSVGCWRLLYAFSENECYPEDLVASSYLVTHRPIGLHWFKVLAVRFFQYDDLDEEGLAQASEEFARYPIELRRTFLWRYHMVGNKAKRMVGSSTVTIRTFGKEAERIQALRELFQINLSADADVHINGRPAALEL